MVILSLFDGMSCGAISLYDMGIIPDTYYASEVDKHAIEQTRLNFPNTIHLGDVRDIDVSKLKSIDLLIGGSPCQSFSFAGKRNGMSTKCEVELTRLEQYLEFKVEGFEFEGQSYLFWEYMRILTDIRKYNPDVLFLLENVEMGKKWERVLSEAIGIYGVHVNSALVSAQNRKRIYWTNIRVKKVGLFGELHSDIPQPADRGILLKDILEKEVDEKYYLSDRMVSFLTNHSDKKQAEGCGFKFNPIDGDKKASTVTQRSYKMGVDDNYVCVSMVGRKTDENGTRKDNDPNLKAVQLLEPNLNGKTNCLTSVQKDNLVLTIKSGTLRTHKDGNGFREVKSGKGACVPARAREDGSGQNVTMIGSRVRRLTPTECARLQTIPDWYTWIVSDTQQYRMLGNGWTNEVIKHILSFIH